jgi:hypothetical protein
MKIAVDFDGTIVEHMYPAIGNTVPGAVDTIKELQAAGHHVFLWTMRSGHELQEAVDHCTGLGITFWGINESPGQREWTVSPKQHANVYIDDAALGCPLQLGVQGKRPRVDWQRVRNGLYNMGAIGDR